jgi:hypothetical protein
MRKLISIWGTMILMLVLIVGTAAAQSGVGPTGTPTSPPAGSTRYMHPIVQILSAYFGRTTRPMLPMPTVTPTQTPTVDPSATATEVPSETPTATPTATAVMGPEEFAEQIARYHEEGMGFGVLVKLYAMAEDSVKACLNQPVTGEAVDPKQPACETVTVEQLVTEFHSGAGMGQLFKQYGKPALLGVGQVRKDLQKQQEELQSTPTPAPSMDSVDLQTQSQKSNKGNGNSNGNGNGNSHKPANGNTPKTHGPKK